MNRIVNFLQKYFAVISVLIGISILLSVTFSSYIVTSNNHKAAEMYIGELKYSIEIDGSTTNTLSVPTGETIIDVKVNNLNPVDTYYKLLYLKNTNITVKYYESTKDTNDVVTTYNKPNDSITSSNSNTIKLLITNSSTSSQNIALTMKGGYITNTLEDIITPSTYSEITLVETPSTNTYFCKTNDTLTQGLKYVNGQYTYAYKQEGKSSSNSSLAWSNITNNGWGVQLTNKTSTDAVTSRPCTYINNKPMISMPYMFYESQAVSIDLSNFNTTNVTNMRWMLSYTKAKALDLSSFDTSNVTDMSFMFNNSIKLKTIYASNKFKTDLVTSSSNMFYNSTLLVGGSGTTYNSSYVDKTYARIDGGTSRPGYFTDIANKPSTFGTDDWATIVNSVKAGNTNHYKVGDTKIVNLGTYGTHTIRVSNTTTPSECSNTNFSQSACGFVLEFEDIITTHVINTTSSNKNGWPASSMRTFVNNDIYNALPADLRNGIINTTTISSHGSSDSANFLSTDKLYLLATAELYENGEDIDTAKNLTRQLDYYKSIGVTINSYSGAIKKSGTTATDWWLRSFYKTNNQHVYSVLRTGRVAHSMASLSIGVSPAFRID